MEWILCLFFAICPTQSQISNTPLEQLEFEGQEILGAEWYVIYVVDEPNQQVVNFSNSYAVIGLTQVDFASYEGESTYFYYDDDMLPYFAILLANYAPYELQHYCENRGVRLFEFAGELNNQNYDIRLYFERNHGDARIIGLYFPVASAPEIDEYTARFYPKILTCPVETEE